MEITNTVAPSYRDLRPLKPVTSDAFPVYPEIADLLVGTTTHPDPVIAHVLATAAAYAYSDDRTVSMIMARMGLKENRCQMVAESVDAMFISATSFLIQSCDGKVVIVAYRGTKLTDVIEWLTNANIDPEKITIELPDTSGTFEVHSGYYRNVRSTRFEIIAALQRALDGQSIDPHGGPMPHSLEALYITGHSLGGAMAALLAVMLLAEPDYAPVAAKLRAVYTIGQTMVGSPEFAKACDANPFLGSSVIRYVYHHDAGPQFPPAASGRFAHFGREYRYVGHRNRELWQLSRTPTKQMQHFAELIGAPLAFLARQVPILRYIPFHASLADHLPQHYLSALTPPGIRSEFGD